MWKFKPFASKEQNGIEGRIIDIGNFKVQVRNVIAEGGFSSVYSARDAIHGSKQYALKHIICNDEESLELVMKEITVMKSLKGHPNVVTLYAHNIFDMGRTKEALLLMEYCEKSLVNVLENRGAGFFEEKQILLIFRDVCNAVFAMHCQTPPIAHRDLKAENLLLGSDGLWKLCDFGSTTTNHKRFEKPEEMGIEEDNIRKHTTPAYRSPEMWDLFRKEVINEKVDIWALGCLLYRICYFKLAFDGESKLQVLNGNYRIPDLPKYSKSITDLIKDMLQSSPNDRPDITQVWFRANGLLPEGLQKSLPDRPPEMEQHSPDVLGGMAKPSNKSTPMPRRSPPPPPLTEAPQNISPSSNNQNTGGSTGPLGAFWASQHAKDSLVPKEKAQPKYDEELTSHERRRASYITPQKTDLQKNSNFQNEGFNAFAADFSTNKPSPGSDSQKSSKEETLKAEVEMLKEQLSHVNMEKAEITSKYEKLSAICRSQRQEIQELKQAVAAKTPSPSRDATRNLATPGSQSSTSTKEKIEGTVLELQQGFFDQRTPSPDSQQQWQAFSDIPKQQTTPTDDTPKSVRTRKDKSGSSNTWGFEADNFKAVPVASSQVNVSAGELDSSKRFGESKNKDSKFASQPSGWAGF